MQRLGLGHDRLKEIRPGLVYCAISGFGQTGPMRGNPAYDQIIQGLSGIMSITGTPETAPLRVGYPVADTLGGLVGAFAIAAALVRQKTSGEGAFLDVSMLECTLSALGWPVSNYLTAGVEPRPMGNENMTAAPSGAFRTGDGLLNIAANKQEQFVALCGLIGRSELASDPRFAERTFDLFEKNPQAALCFTAYGEIDDHGRATTSKISLVKHSLEAAILGRREQVRGTRLRAFLAFGNPLLKNSPGLQVLTHN